MRITIEMEDGGAAGERALARRLRRIADAFDPAEVEPEKMAEDSDDPGHGLIITPDGKEPHLYVSYHGGTICAIRDCPSDDLSADDGRPSVEQLLAHPVHNGQRVDEPKSGYEGAGADVEAQRG